MLFQLRLRSILTAVPLLALLVSCGGDEPPVAEKPALQESDGAQITALMKDARTAVQNRDAAAFRALFLNEADARAIWAKLERLSWLQGDWHVKRVMQYPELKRAQPGLHVERLYLHAWFDLSRETGSPADVYETSWEFARSDSAWAIRNVRLARTSTSYHALIRELFHMGYAQYETLAMDWEKSVDPVPLLERWLRAAEASDPVALASRSVAGVYERAFKKNIDLPGIYHGDKRAAAENRKSARESMEAQAKAIRDAYASLGLEPGGLAPFFGAYGIGSMPRDCTCLKLYTVFTGVDVPESDVTQFSTEWMATYINNRWLVENLAVKSIKPGG